MSITTFESHAVSYAIFGLINLSSAISVWLSTQIRFLYSTCKICIVDICVFWPYVGVTSNTCLCSVSSRFTSSQCYKDTCTHIWVFMPTLHVTSPSQTVKKTPRGVASSVRRSYRPLPQDWKTSSTWKYLSLWSVLLLELINVGLFSSYKTHKCGLQQGKIDNEFCHQRL